MNITINKYEIMDIFDRNKSFLDQNKIFIVPRYQRSYSWKEKQWKEIFDDAERAFKKEDLDIDFWGTIIVHEKNNKYYIVDGQQRIITLLLMLLVSGFNVIQYEKIPIKFSNELDNEVWRKICHVEPLKTNDEKSLLFMCKTFLENKIQTVDKRLFLSFLSKTVLSVVVIDDEVEGNLLFGRLNTRGIPLNDIDLIKYHIFYKVDAKSGSQMNDTLLENWNKMVKKLEGIKIDLNTFMSVWLQYKYGINPENLFKEFEFLGDIDYIVFLKDIINFLEEITVIINAPKDKISTATRNIPWLIKFGTDKAILIMISLLETTFNTKRQKHDLIDIVTNIEFSRELLREKNVKYDDDTKLDDLYEKYCKSFKIMSLETSIELVNQFKQDVLEIFVAIDDFQRAFIKLRYKSGHYSWTDNENSLTKYAITSLANWEDDLTKGLSNPKARQMDDDEYSIEHIVPKKNAANDDSLEYQIGNLMVLEKDMNTALADKDIQDKVSYYKKSQYEQVRTFILKKNRKKKKWGNPTWEARNFNQDYITLRAEALSSEFYEYFLKKIK